MVLNIGTEIALFVFVFIFGAFTAAAFGAIAFALVKLNKKIDSLTDKVDPVIVKISDTLETVQRVTMNVGEKADRILTRGETVTELVSQKVESAASIVQKAVTTPLINLSSIITGVTKGFSAYTHSGENGKETKRAAKDS